MGSPDPWGKGYMAAGGTETKLMVDDEWLGTVQGFTFDGTRGEGSITFIRFDKKAEEKMKSLFSQTKRLTLRAFDGYPTEAFNLLDAEVVFAPGESFGVSTDDLIIDTTLGFSVKERYDVPKPNKEG